MTNSMVVIHERLGVWARQLRPRLASWPVRWFETRSASDLESALRGTACPIVVIDLGTRPRAGLDDLDRAARTSPNALILVLEPDPHDGVATLARELGATHVMRGVATPPAVAALLGRWLSLAQRRTEWDGWATGRPNDTLPEPWNWLAPYLNPPSPPPDPKKPGPPSSRALG